jgi:cation diffusion facilitator family transporter
VATFVGVGGAVVLGARWSILDPLAAVIVAVFIFCMGLKMTFPAIEELLEKSLPEELENEIKQVIAATPGVKTFHHLRTRRNGFRVIVEVHLKIDADITVAEGHRIATNAEERLSKLVAGEALITTHIEPYKGEAIEGDGSCS